MPQPKHTHNTAAEFNNSVRDSAYENASAMQKYFGPLRHSEVDTFASDAFAHETHNLPRAYIGRNKFLMATIDFLITKDDDWYTRYVLPWLYTEELHVKWNIWRFNRTMMDYEPEQGVPRYVSYESESRSDSLVRRGLAFIIEHGFYKTELGRQHYLMNLKQIVEAVHETVYFGVMHELIAAPNFYQEWTQKHGTVTVMNNNTSSAMAEERWRFACVQKDIKGLFILDAEIKDRMRRVGIEPNAWIFPSKMAIYASMVPEYFNEFSRGGEAASSALEKGATRFNNFRGCRVFETRPFDTDFMAQGAVEPLIRDREIGEFYVMGSEVGSDDGEMRIFDMSRDKFHTIHISQVRAHAWEGERDEDNGPEVLQLLVKDFLDRHEEVPAMQAWIPNLKRAVREKRHDPDLWKEHIAETAKEVYDTGKRILVPHKYILFRPRMTYRMGTAILLKGGEELGQTLHGHHDFQLTDDVIHKTHIGHYTFYSKSVVRESKNMYLAEDVYCCGYHGGENCKFITENNFETEYGKKVTADSSSIIAIAVPIDFDPPAAMSVLGTFEDLGVTMSNDNSEFCTSSVLKRLSAYMGDTALNGRTDEDHHCHNAVCFRGAEQTKRGGNFEQTQQNTGHWGPSVYDGCAAVRQGMYAHLLPPGTVNRSSGTISY